MKTGFTHWILVVCQDNYGVKVRPITEGICCGPPQRLGCERQGLRPAFELLGESVREIGVLLAVFVPLDAAFYQGQLGFVTLICLALIEFAGLALIAVGIMLERR